MFTKPQNTPKRLPLVDKNNIESPDFTPATSQTSKNIGQQMTDFTGNVMDQLFGNYPAPDRVTDQEAIQSRAPARKIEKSVFSFRNYHEKEVVSREIKALTDEIKKALEVVKRESSDLVKDAQQLTVNTVSENPGIYHQRFLEVILVLLRNLRAKIGESRTWMEAMVTKKKKRGSLFVTRSKEKGTQYSLSEEQKITRSVQ